VGEHAVKWPENPAEIKRAGEKARLLPGERWLLTAVTSAA
jgi:hypothetical protein